MAGRPATGRRILHAGVLRARRASAGRRVSGRVASAGPQVTELAKLARAVATETGDLLLSRHGQATVVQTKSSPTDVVTEMDTLAEQLIRRRILAARPGDAILGEEGGEVGTGAVRWIVDPLDGSVNYLYGLSDWAVSIAAEVDGQVVAGAVSVPLHQSLFFATAGGGAWLRSEWRPGEQRLSCTTGVALADALVGTGFGYDVGQRVIQGQVVASVLPRVRDIRRAGAAAVDLCSLAAGRLDAFYERGLHEWDFAAGGLIAREAGALVGGLHGGPPSESMILAAGPGLFAELHDLLAKLDPERDT
jgi:fructose-1,6-bisphosphatase/inositol monophosphatase family enzyme